MKCSICVFSFIFIFANLLSAQEQLESANEVSGMISGLRRRAVILDINTRVLENAESTNPQGDVSRELNVIWNEEHQKVTMPGSPVGIQMVGSNVVVSVQFTPFIRRHGNVLVAQGQIWINDPDNGVSYYTSIQTIPIEFDEPIYFFPLGQSGDSNRSSSIEIILTLNPFRDPENPEAAISQNNDE